ncbi:cytochrome P450 CYP4BN11 [Tribolium castaneum]|uniref:Cytochrome P450-like protein n=1 Tax=Tribolium castaneum TaxID=7070 RepID=D6WN38_TRICA|nr:cytochrome P450 CYP4BN11 [Tribolium castaneum]EFA04693.1 cytochrome P450-like protein [Tribolium castaneum]|eukprot:NP_001123994.1 cytochrome P450 CYP4BN11 [Tribolium castaneum]
MEILFTLFILLLCLLLYFYNKYVYIFDKNLKDYPAPPQVPILGHTLDFVSGKGFLDVLLSYTHKYGDIVRIRPGPIRQLLLTSNYKLFEAVLSNAKITKKSADYKFFHRWLGTGLLTSDGAKWKKHRQIITPTFHFQILENFVDVFEKNGKILTKQLEKHLNEDSVNVYGFVNLCALDIICEAAMGTSVKAQENMNSEYVRSVKDLLDTLMGRIFSPYKMIDFIYFFTEDYKKEMKALQVIHSYTRNVIKSRQAAINSGEFEQKTKKNFLDLLLAANEQQMTLEEIREEVDTFMFAGHDTTASTISFALFCLANHPDEQARVYREQKDIFGDDFKRAVTFQDLKKMKYLEYVIKETLRLYPVGPFFSRELDKDVPFAGKVLPKGLTITLFIYAMHRNPEYFPDPEKFNPSRFETFDGKMPFAFVPFGAGPRNCLGQKFAMLEMLSVVSRVVRTYKILPSIPRHEINVAAQVVLISTNGMRMRFEKRSEFSRK